MYNRAEVVDKNFVHFVSEGRLPPARTALNLSQVNLKPDDAVDLFESQVVSRHLDLRARLLKNTNDCYYTIGSSGHEGNAVFGKVFKRTDMAFLHYRSGAFMVQRSKQLPGATPIYDLLLSFTASSEDPIAGGRHKVFGSKELLVPPQTSTIASHLPKAVGAALSIPRARDLKIKSVMPQDSIVICSFGDASANHSSALGAFNTAGWAAYQNIPMPMVFICEDNHIGISVPTAEAWIERSFSRRPSIKYISCDGLSLLDLYRRAMEAEDYCRTYRKPVFLHMDTVRLLGHAGSDVESAYNSLKKIEANEFDDPLLHSARILIENSVLSKEDVIQIYEKTREKVAAVAEYTVTRPKLTEPQAVKTSITACTDEKPVPALPSEEERKTLFGRDLEKQDFPHHMAKLINWGLADILLQYKNTLIFGEDVAQKGGVYHVTDGLHKKFGPRRVFNSPLDETSIIGTGIGLAHNGFLPIPEIQFLAYVHNAEDQIRGEASTLAFFSQGQFTNPMVLRIAGLAYQKGFGGHFHNDNSLTVFRDLPGVILAVPSNGADAVKMLRTAVRQAYCQGRVVIFVEPIALYMTRDLHFEGDKAWSFSYPQVGEEIELGEFGVYGSGTDLAIISYGNGTYYSRQAIRELEERHKISCRMIDLRWLSDIDYQKLGLCLSDCQNILIVEECRREGSHAEGLLSHLYEEMQTLPPVKILAAEDCFIPLGPAAAAGLPKKDEILDVALKLVKK